jgi:ABC-type Fe3+ transport system substrate-binding protein
MKRVIPWLLLALPAMNAFAQEAQVVVMTSYPQELINRYESAFETAHPDIDLVLEWRRSDDARLLLESGSNAVDVYWAPSLDTFVTLADAGYFAKLPLPFEGVPGRIGQLRVDDAQSRFAAFEVAGFGIAYSPQWLQQHGLDVPHDWAALRDPRYAQALLLPVPSRQGFSPMIYQSVLSGLGWEAGWALLTELGAEGELLASGGGSFIDELAAGTRGLALSIDFFAKSAQLSGQNVGFRYADTTLLSPAYVAQLAKAPHVEAARVFLDFALSEEGQRLLSAPDVSRLPVRPSVYTEDAAFNPFATSVTVPAFDFNQAGPRLGLMSALFDVQITARHDELRALLTRIDTALASADGNAHTTLLQARQMLTAPALDLASAEYLVSRLQSGELSVEALPTAQWAQTLAQRQREVERLLATAIR